MGNVDSNLRNISNVEWISESFPRLFFLPTMETGRRNVREKKQS
jgi:hypothetical protein